MNPVIEWLLVALLAVGSFFVLVGSLGLVKLSEFFKRLHGPTKASTLGVGCILIASIGYHALLGDGLGLREILITLFLFITAPISAHLMARAALQLTPDQRPEQPAADTASLSDAVDHQHESIDDAARTGRSPDR
ncbi:MAG: Na+/H+ antiporter subunit G [Pseudomonadota bacterium]|nr:Na+/H+ antiporter subunit G [Pseudomonadota bacterium]